MLTQIAMRWQKKSKTGTTLTATFGGAGGSQVMSSDSSPEEPFLRMQCAQASVRGGSTIILRMTEDSKAQKG